MLGYDKIPEVWKAGLPAIADTRFAFTQYSFNEIVASTMARAQKVIASAGGGSPRRTSCSRAGAEGASARAMARRPAAKRIAYTDPAWTWQGTVRRRRPQVPGAETRFKEATAQGAKATLTFEGTGIAIVGRCTQEGGRADVSSTTGRRARSTPGSPRGRTTTTTGT